MKWKYDNGVDSQFVFSFSFSLSSVLIFALYLFLFLLFSYTVLIIITWCLLKAPLNYDEKNMMLLRMKKFKQKYTSPVWHQHTQNLSPPPSCTPHQLPRGSHKRRLYAPDFPAPPDIFCKCWCVHLAYDLTMANSSDLSEQKIAMIIGFLDGGKKTKERSEQIGISKSTVWKWCECTLVCIFWHQNSITSRFSSFTALAVIWGLVSGVVFITFTDFFLWIPWPSWAWICAW